ncbi:MBL fold metallo-hydrolase [Piscinibacter terrae]|nr:MBL fold metallo-hydrolase [Albitalea terrae]
MQNVLFRLGALVTTLLMFGAAAPLHAADEPPLELRTYRADGRGFNVASTLVVGKTDAVLIDAQFTRADAHRVVGQILDSGKKLKAIFISQGDPDYYFGLEVIHQAFPQAQILATGATVSHIQASLPEKLKVWRPMLGANGPQTPIVPTALKGNAFELEGQRLEVIGLDGPSPLYTFVWIPSIQAVVGGVRVFGNMHLWMTDSASAVERQCWINDLKRIEALGPRTVVAGHAKPGQPADLSSVHYSIDYLTAYGEEMAKAANSDALKVAMKTRYPQAIGEEVLDLGAKVNKGEMKWVAATGCR